MLSFAACSYSVGNVWQLRWLESGTDCNFVGSMLFKGQCLCFVSKLTGAVRSSTWKHPPQTITAFCSASWGGLDQELAARLTSKLGKQRNETWLPGPLLISSQLTAVPQLTRETMSQPIWWLMLSASSDVYHKASTIKWNWGPNRPSGLIGALLTSFRDASGTAAAKCINATVSTM